MEFGNSVNLKKCKLVVLAVPLKRALFGKFKFFLTSLLQFSSKFFARFLLFRNRGIVGNLLSISLFVTQNLVFGTFFRLEFFWRLFAKNYSPKRLSFLLSFHLIYFGKKCLEGVFCGDSQKRKTIDLYLASLLVD